MPRWLQELKDKLTDLELKKRIQTCLDLWKLWEEAAWYVRTRTLTKEEMKRCRPTMEEFFRFFVQNFQTENGTWYLHHLRAHVPQYSKWLCKEFGWGYGVLSNQSLEHRLKQIKRALRNSFANKKKYHMTLRALLQKRYGWFGMSRPFGRKLRCPRCGGPHQRNYRGCEKR